MVLGSGRGLSPSRPRRTRAAWTPFGGIGKAGKDFFSRKRPASHCQTAGANIRCCTSSIPSVVLWLAVPLPKVQPRRLTRLSPGKIRRQRRIREHLVVFLKHGNLLTGGRNFLRQRTRTQMAMRHTSRLHCLRGHWLKSKNRAEMQGGRGTYHPSQQLGDDASCLTGSRPVGKLPHSQTSVREPDRRVLMSLVAASYTVRQSS